MVCPTTRPSLPPSAYVYMFIEGLADGGVRAGLPRNIAQTLVRPSVCPDKCVIFFGSHAMTHTMTFVSNAIRW